jgi:hypothetical protein
MPHNQEKADFGRESAQACPAMPPVGAASDDFRSQFQTANTGANRAGFSGTLAVRAMVSHEERPAKIGDRLRSNVFDPATPVRTEVIIAQAVLFGVD